MKENRVKQERILYKYTTSDELEIFHTLEVSEFSCSCVHSRIYSSCYILEQQASLSIEHNHLLMSNIDLSLRTDFQLQSCHSFSTSNPAMNKPTLKPMKLLTFLYMFISV